MSNNILNNALNEFEFSEVYFGNQGFQIAKPSEINELQIGYSIDAEGANVTGSEVGDWHKCWIVFAKDDSTSDPYFVDSSEESLPVFTAMHGAGYWRPIRASNSLSKFLNCLRHLNSKSPQEASLTEPNEGTITSTAEIADLQNHLSATSGGREFWDEFFEHYREWLAEYNA